ncbi:hypothetical protein HYV30_03220 [Candidatus Kaiserbacteria bacterium]|nr:hypothetical protein [Candidatus Kaiserbacteria bacterium]
MRRSTGRRGPEPEFNRHHRRTKAGGGHSGAVLYINSKRHAAWSLIFPGNFSPAKIVNKLNGLLAPAGNSVLSIRRSNGKVYTGWLGPIHRNKARTTEAERNAWLELYPNGTPFESIVGEINELWLNPDFEIVAARQEPERDVVPAWEDCVGACWLERYQLV